MDHHFCWLQNSFLLRSAEVPVVKAIAPVLRTASTPVVGIWGRVVKFYAAKLPCPKQRIREQKNPSPS